ncbi:MAG TPA: glycoside hydrolase family 43 protein [Blastocatellia bacterium]|nr:glycoside hydrolase family 43 protein [Blastocatellia bacterium]
MNAVEQMADQMTYLNPVHLSSCPDPFVLKHLNEYWCYSTGIRPDGRCFGVLHSRDLIHWREIGGALEPGEMIAPCWWAPEVWYENGAFLMYYSVGNEEQMQIRVARADHPAGPFTDCGVRLTSEEFAIDAHIFADDDGSRWMFYATDFLTHTHIGTGTVCDRMLDPFTLAGEPRPVTRARFDWQIYDPHRIEKGGVRWHTVEGPFVLKRKGRYYEMFSAGNWKNETYGVSFATTETIETDDEWAQAADGERVLPILRTIPGEVIGPGHNSVVRGPDNRQLYCIYHRWSPEVNERVLAIDPLDWAGERMFIAGPSSTPQPAPTGPSFADYFETDYAHGLGEHWWCSGGHWSARAGIATQEVPEGEAEAQCSLSAPYFIAELSLRMPDRPEAAGGAGVKLVSEQEPALYFTLVPQATQAVITAQSGGHWRHEALSLPSQFDFTAFHLLRVEVNARRVTITVDDTTLEWEGALDAPPTSVALFTRDARADFAGFALTQGWEDLFTGLQGSPAALNWQTTADDERWQVSEQQLWYIGPHGESSILTKGPLPEKYELVINAKLIGEPKPGECYGFLPAMSAEGSSPLLTVERADKRWAVCYDTPTDRQLFPLPHGFDPFEYQQFRFRRAQNRLTIQHEMQTLGEIEVQGEAGLAGLYGYRVVAAFDLVRVTALE